MTRDDLNTALDRYGGRPEAWPDHVRVAIEELCARDAEAATAVAAAARLDTLLAEALAPGEADATFIGGVIAGLEHDTARDITLRPTGRLFAWASAATVASIALGFMIGIAVPQDIGEDAFAGLMFGTSYEAEAESVL